MRGVGWGRGGGLLLLLLPQELEDKQPHSFFLSHRKRKKKKKNFASLSLFLRLLKARRLSSSVREAPHSTLCSLPSGRYGAKSRGSRARERKQQAAADLLFPGEARGGALPTIVRRKTPSSAHSFLGAFSTRLLSRGLFPCSCWHEGGTPERWARVF